MTHPSYLLASAILVMLPFLGSCTFKIQSPPSLVSAIKSLSANPKDIEYALAHFGKTGYGMTLYGYAHFYTEMEDGCGVVNINPVNSNDVLPFLFVKRGGCTFVQKALMAQKSGASALVIVDDQDEKLDFTPIALQRGSDAQIPCIVISKKVGETIIKALKSSPVIVSYSNPVKRTEVPELLIASRLDDYETFKFMGEFSQMAESISYELNFIPYIGECVDCSPETIETDCYNKNTKYCFYSYGTNVKGIDVLASAAIQYCFASSLTDNSDFFNFAETFKDTCFDADGSLKKDPVQCTITSILAYKNSYSQTDFNECLPENASEIDYIDVLSAIKEKYNARGISLTPVVAINKKPLQVIYC